jgi:hypothetical protein
VQENTQYNSGDGVIVGIFLFVRRRGLKDANAITGTTLKATVENWAHLILDGSPLPHGLGHLRKEPLLLTPAKPQTIKPSAAVRAGACEQQARGARDMA